MADDNPTAQSGDSASTSPSNLPVTFHLFANFPVEIKLLVWEHAVKEANKIIHFQTFTLPGEAQIDDKAASEQEHLGHNGDINGFADDFYNSLKEEEQAAREWIQHYKRKECKITSGGAQFLSLTSGSRKAAKAVGITLDGSLWQYRDAGRFPILVCLADQIIDTQLHGCDVIDVTIHAAHLDLLMSWPPSTETVASIISTISTDEKIQLADTIEFDFMGVDPDRAADLRPDLRNNINTYIQCMCRNAGLENQITFDPIDITAYEPWTLCTCISGFGCERPIWECSLDESYVEDSMYSRHDREPQRLWIVRRSVRKFEHIA
jgi:hypothetical protein